MPIDEIIVELDRDVLEHQLVRNGFVRRYQRNAGGRFITPHDIERSPDRSTEDLLRRMPGVHARPVGTNDTEYGARRYEGDAILMESPRGLCRPTVYVDGTRIGYDPESGQTLTSYVPLHTVQAVEVYRSPAEVPVEYNITRSDELCGVLVIWTK
jgi:outer membrane cobalamin receptor